jgi:long-chain acyl-CoA synthetase
LLHETVVRHPERPAISYRVGADTDAHWTTLTWHEFALLILDTADLLDHIFPPGKPVAVLADTDARYPILELALALTGRPVQPLYVTATDEELRQTLDVTNAAGVVLGTAHFHRLTGGSRPRLPLVSLVRLPGVGGRGAEVLPADVEPFDTNRVQQRLQRFTPSNPDRSLLFLQTTGTTGPPKVLDLSERAVLSAVAAVRTETSVAHPRFLSFLPTAHISERLLTLYVSLTLAGHTYYGGGLDTLLADMQDCHPTVFVAPPLVLEGMRAEALRAASATRLGRTLAKATTRATEKALAHGVAGSAPRPVGARLFGAKLRRQCGLAQVQDAFVGTAPASADLQAWWEVVGMPVRNVYGQTEVAGATSITARRGSEYASVGRAVAGVQMRLGAEDELLVRTSSCFTGYVSDDQATADTLVDGWLHTGDRARLDASGELVLLGRVHGIITVGTHRLDAEELARRIRTMVGPCDAVVAPTTSGPVLYVAFPAPDENPATPFTGQPAPIDAEDVRWAVVRTALRRLDARSEISEIAVLEGTFPIVTGEVGPTGKLRTWRIHDLRQRHLRPCAHEAAASTC